MEKNRVGLKEIAELSGMSVGNVSMVLRGLGDEARISKATKMLQKKYLGVENDIIKQQRVRNKNNDFASDTRNGCG